MTWGLQAPGTPPVRPRCRCCGRPDLIVRADVRICQHCDLTEAMPQAPWGDPAEPSER